MNSRFESEFPADLWAAAGLADRGAALALARRDLDRLERFNAAPRDPELINRFFDRHLPEGAFLIYGAGIHTRVILDILRRRPRTRIVGVIDRMAADIGEFLGLPVYAPEDAVCVPHDWILLSHGTYEEEMIERLLSVGAPLERVIPIYAHPHSLAAAAEMAEKRLRPLAGRPVKTLIVGCSQSAVIADQTLAALFAPETTLKAHFGRPDGYEDAGVFETVDLCESLAGLDWLVRNLGVETVFVRSVIYKNYLGYWLKARHPRLRVIHELYDHAVVWRDHDLERLFGLTPRTLGRLRAMEYAGAQICDLIVSKRGGAHWERAISECQAPYRLYFPMMQESVGAPLAGAPLAGAPLAGDAPATARNGDFVYAGFLPSPQFLKQFKNGYDFLETMIDVCRMLGVGGALYNSSHSGPDAERIYAPYRARHVGAPLEYRGRLPYDALLNVMQGFAFGWLCDIVREFQADRHVGVCNRWTGYVSAGLPVVLDAEWTLMAELTRQDGAGLVVERTDPALIAAAIRNADQEALRRGGRRLRRRLLDHNAATLGDLAAAAGL